MHGYEYVYVYMCVCACLHMCDSYRARPVRGLLQPYIFPTKTPHTHPPNAPNDAGGVGDSPARFSTISPSKSGVSKGMRCSELKATGALKGCPSVRRCCGGGGLLLLLLLVGRGRGLWVWGRVCVRVEDGESSKPPSPSLFPRQHH